MIDDLNIEINIKPIYEEWLKKIYNNVINSKRIIDKFDLPKEKSSLKFEPRFKEDTAEDGFAFKSIESVKELKGPIYTEAYKANTTNTIDLYWVNELEETLSSKTGTKIPKKVKIFELDEDQQSNQQEDKDQIKKKRAIDL